MVGGAHAVRRDRAGAGEVVRVGLGRGLDGHADGLAVDLPLAGAEAVVERRVEAPREDGLERLARVVRRVVGLDGLLDRVEPGRQLDRRHRRVVAARGANAVQERDAGEVVRGEDAPDDLLGDPVPVDLLLGDRVDLVDVGHLLREPDAAPGVDLERAEGAAVADARRAHADGAAGVAEEPAERRLVVRVRGDAREDDDLPAGADLGAVHGHRRALAATGVLVVADDLVDDPLLVGRVERPELVQQRHVGAQDGGAVGLRVVGLAGADLLALGGALQGAPQPGERDADVRAVGLAVELERVLDALGQLDGRVVVQPLAALERGLLGRQGLALLPLLVERLLRPLREVVEEDGGGPAQPNPHEEVVALQGIRRRGGGSGRSHVSSCV